MCEYKRHFQALKLGDALFALVGLIFVFHWYLERYAIVEQFGRSGAIILSAVLLMSQLFGSVGAVKISTRLDKVVYYKVLGFRQFDVVLLSFHTFALSAITFSIFFATAFNIFVYDIGVWIAACYFVFQLIFVYTMLLLLSKAKFKPRKSKRAFRSWDKLFINKYISITIKELFEIRSHPSLILENILIIPIAYFLILIEANYVLAVYILLSISAVTYYESFAADEERHFLYKLLQVSRYQLFKYKWVPSVVFALFLIVIYTVFYIILVGNFMTLGFVLLPIVLINGCLQHFALGIICAKKYPFSGPFTMFFTMLWIISAVPGISIALYIYAFFEMRKLRKEQSLSC